MNPSKIKASDPTIKFILKTVYELKTLAYQSRCYCYDEDFNDPHHNLDFAIDHIEKAIDRLEETVEFWHLGKSQIKVKLVK